MHKEYILLNGFRKAKRGFTAGFHVPLRQNIPVLLNNAPSSIIDKFLTHSIQGFFNYVKNLGRNDSLMYSINQK